MANSKCRWQCPEQWSEWSEWLAAGLHARNRWRLPVLLIGVLFASGRRTVTTWLRAAGVSADFQDYYYALAALGHKTESVGNQLGAQDALCGLDQFWYPTTLDYWNPVNGSFPGSIGHSLSKGAKDGEEASIASSRAGHGQAGSREYCGCGVRGRGAPPNRNPVHRGRRCRR